MAKIDELIRHMKQQGASDLHLTSGAPPYLRLNGEMVKLNYKPVTADVCRALIYEILSEQQKQLFQEQWELDFSYVLPDAGRCRVNVFMQQRGMGVVIRLIPERVLSVAELGLPEQLLDLINVSEGLILVTGPTGSGKSTTLAAMVHEINQAQRAHIITIEDPIEFVHTNEQSLVNQREVSSHTQSFSNALRAALREDPDVILVGEMRDLETMSLALTAAETGHLVLATLHTNSAIKTVDRIIDVFPEYQQAQVRAMLSESLRGVVAQALVLRADGLGRVPVLEILVNVPAIAHLIREGKTHQLPSVLQTGQAHGMLTFENSASDLVRRGLIAKEEGARFLARRQAGRSSSNPNLTNAPPATPAGRTTRY
jgi:twitching motility protein PilT